jgi:hypothetical protein
MSFHSEAVAALHGEQFRHAEMVTPGVNTAAGILELNISGQASRRRPPHV